MLMTALAAALTLPAEPPSRVQLLPAPSPTPFSLADGRGPYLLQDGAAVAAASRAVADLPIDFDHSIDKTGGGPAAGWIKAVSADADGVWGEVQWTDRGRQALAGRDYRYLSPVFLHRASGEIVKVVRAALTNDPAMTTLRALASRVTDEDDMDLDTLLKALRTALGLAATAGADQVVAAASRIVADATARATDAEALSVALCAKKDATAAELLAAAKATATGDQAKIDALEKEVASIKASAVKDKALAEVDRVIEAGKLAPAQRDWAVGYASREPAAFAEFAQTLPVIVKPGTAGQTRAAPPAREASDPEVIALCGRLGIKVEDFLKTEAAKAAAAAA